MEKRRYPFSQRDMKASLRAARAIELRGRRMTYQQIAVQLGYADRQSCQRAVQRALNRMIVGNMEEMRREELATLDALQGQVMEVVFNPKKSVGARLRGVERVLSIMHRRAKLMGLYVNTEQQETMVKVVVREAR